MESVEQPFDSITRLGQDLPDTNDKLGLIDTDGPLKYVSNGDSPGAEISPLHQMKSTNSVLYGPQNRGLRIIIISSIVFAMAVTVALILTIYLEPKPVHGHAAVACDDIRCSEIGLKVLKDGGNAVDAAVAATLCLAVVDPAHAGIGGGGFSLVHDHKFKKSWSYNFLETVPKQLDLSPENIGLINSSSKSAGIPGLVKGLNLMHQNHGRLQWDLLVQPAIDLAENGFLVSEELATVLEKQSDFEDFQDKVMSDLFLDGSMFKKQNSNITWKSLAKTLKKIASDPDSLYTGSLLTDFLNDVSKANGVINEEDMRNYTVEQLEVLKTKYKQWTVVSLPPPAGGVLVALILKMVDKLGWNEKQYDDSLTYHQLIESFKFAFAHRALLGDPNFNSSMQQNVEELLNDEFVSKLVNKIDNNKTHSESTYYGPFLPGQSAGTSHVSVIDSSELMVSISLSMNNNFGSKTLLETTGILLNDELLNFDLINLTSANGIAHGKRPLSSMSPTVIYDEEHPCNYRLIIGGSGGLKLTTGLTQSIINAIDFKMNISKAINRPRIHNELDPTTFYEDGIPQSVLGELKIKGHNLMKFSLQETSSIIALQKINDEIQANADYRKNGGTAVY